MPRVGAPKVRPGGKSSVAKPKTPPKGKVVAPNGDSIRKLPGS